MTTFISLLEKAPTPNCIKLGSDGVLYLSEYYHNAIMRIEGENISDVGNRDGPADRATFCNPCGMAIGPDGAIYVADRENNCIRPIKDRVVSTFAGRKESGFKDGPIREALFNGPSSLLWTPGNVLLICDTSNNRIRAIQDNKVMTIAGNGDDDDSDGPALSAGLYKPISFFLSSTGVLYIIADGAIRILEDGKISTFVARNDPPRLKWPFDIQVDFDGTIYVADCGNSRIVAFDSPSQFKILVPNGSKENSLRDPCSIQLDIDGGLLVLDMGSKKIERIQIRPHRGHTIDLRAFVPVYQSPGVTSFSFGGNARLYVHQSLMRLRGLSEFQKVLDSLKAHPSDSSGVKSFVEFIYSDELLLRYRATNG
jgi:DNA-binding beta-propeller fold protein YncE